MFLALPETSFRAKYWELFHLKQKNSQHSNISVTLIKWLWLFIFGSLISLKEAVARRCSVKKVFLKISQNSQENKKETLAQVFSCEFCEIFKNAFFIEHLRWLLLHLIEV